MKINEIVEPAGEGGELIEVPIGTDFDTVASPLDERIYIWSLPKTDNLGRTYLVEVKGNSNLHLTKQYYYRYDPPRTASTGKGKSPQGDHHVFDGKELVAAWTDEGTARHGFSAGDRIPNKAFKALQKKFPDAKVPPNGILEQVQKQFHNRAILLENINFT